MKFVTYQVRNVVTGRAYFGSTCRPEKRWSRHKTDLRSGTHHVPQMIRDFAAHGLESFVFEILEEFTDKASARAKETELIQGDDGGYNQGESATSVWHKDPVARAAQRAAIVRATTTKAHREAARKRARKQFSDPTARAEAARKQREFIKNNPERARQIAIAGGKAVAHLARKRARPIVREDGLEFDAVRDAARHMRPDDHERARCCIKQALKQGNRALGFYWRYKDDTECRAALPGTERRTASRPRAT